MEMQINNSFLYGCMMLLSIWAVLGVFALALISMRRDKEFVYDDINKILLKPTWYLQVISLLLLYAILPISIPYSIAHIIKK